VKILFDTNVILDVMLLRDPFFKTATLLLAEVEKKEIKGYICPTTVTTIFYLVSKVKGSAEARKLITNLLQIFEASKLDKSILETALNPNFKDYEDSVLYESAVKTSLDGIVTRDRKDFRNSKLPVFDPEELFKLITQLK
jgi:predicted nucleic acid-binding protein